MQSLSGKLIIGWGLNPQRGGAGYLYLSDNAAVVLRPDGQVVTVWGAPEFNATTRQILQDAREGP
jgi:hypothetical protein